MSGPQVETSECRDILRYAFLNDAAQVQSFIENIARREQQSFAVIAMASRDEAGSSMLHYAALKGHVEMADRILAEFNNYRPDLIIPFAARKGHRYFCEVMLEAGANATTKNNAGKTPVGFAREALATNEAKLVDAQGKLSTQDDEAAMTKGAEEITRLQDVKQKLEGTFQYLEGKVRASDQARGNAA
ncbi:Uu.00g027760.m01.CDS01 [Anthostomella pinea]|uniref:Uu.00g027760.m01.CDS01 n=1 Tax=Anthostomella pinea TaxID=933095 RepID=A0AAI8YCV4_9PEZI|nr:Uu.00g027760.m01.CDS01 [Anthostomella pinea]